MKRRTLLLMMLLVSVSASHAQTFTMGKKCREALANAQATLENKSYQEALTLYQAFADKCRTRDAKEQAAVGMAEAYNGLGMYAEAIAQADAALKITKDRSLAGHFQKALALENQGDAMGARNQLARVMELTEKNENTAQRASNYALMADLYARQMGQMDSAQAYLERARQLDPNNVKYTILEGDLYLAAGEYDRAYSHYEAAATMDPNSLDVYIAKSNTSLKKMEQKYGTSSAQELNNQMTPAEKAILCKDMGMAFDLGWKDMNKELFKALICK